MKCICNYKRIIRRRINFVWYIIFLTLLIKILSFLVLYIMSEGSMRLNPNRILCWWQSRYNTKRIGKANKQFLFISMFVCSRAVDSIKRFQRKNDTMKKKKQIFHRFGCRSIKNLITKIDNSFRNPKKDAGRKMQKNSMHVLRKEYLCRKNVI